MKLRSFIPCALAALLGASCSSSDADTSPLPPQDSQARVADAQKKVEASNMTPEQKQAAAEYLKRGAEGARQMQNSAPGGSR